MHTISLLSPFLLCFVVTPCFFFTDNRLCQIQPVQYQSCLVFIPSIKWVYYVCESLGRIVTMANSNTKTGQRRTRLAHGSPSHPRFSTICTKRYSPHLRNAPRLSTPRTTHKTIHHSLLCTTTSSLKYLDLMSHQNPAAPFG